MRGAVAKSNEASRAAARVAAVDAGEYALRGFGAGASSTAAAWSWVRRMITILVGGAARATRAVVASYGSTTTTTSPTKLWYYMASGGQGGPVVITHPDDDDAGSTNANNDDNAPPPPPKNNGDAPRGEGDRTKTVPDDDAMAVAASRDAVVTNATSAVGRRGARDLRAAADGMGGFMIMCLVSFDRRVGSGRDGGLDGAPPPKNVERDIYEYVDRKNIDTFFTTNFSNR
jgi:hypothetical protein